MEKIREVPSCSFEHSTFDGRTKIAILGGRESNNEATDEYCTIMGHRRQLRSYDGEMEGRKKGRIRKG
jgi:hypothetical protein